MEAIQLTSNDKFNQNIYFSVNMTLLISDLNG